MPEKTVALMLAPYSTRSIAEALQMAPDNVSSWRVGRYLPSPQKLRPLAEYIAAEEAADEARRALRTRTKPPSPAKSDARAKAIFDELTAVWTRERRQRREQRVQHRKKAPSLTA